MSPKLDPNHPTVLRFDLECTDGTFETDDFQVHPCLTLPNCFPEPKLPRATYSVCLSGERALTLDRFAQELELVAKIIRHHAGRLALEEMRHAARTSAATSLDPDEEYDTSNDPPVMNARELAQHMRSGAAEKKPAEKKKPRAPRRSKAELNKALLELCDQTVAAGVDPVEVAAINCDEKKTLTRKLADVGELLSHARAAAPAHTHAEQPPLPGTD